MHCISNKKRIRENGRISLHLVHTSDYLLTGHTARASSRMLKEEKVGKISHNSLINGAADGIEPVVKSIV